MSRVIKFRCWNGTKMMYQKDGFGIYRLEQILDDDFHEPMQFTGLLDVNGVEIYEGDFIDWMGGIFSIRWEDSDASFFAVRTDEVMAESGQEWSGSCVVIGNIHQNPEILK